MGSGEEARAAAIAASYFFNERWQQFYVKPKKLVTNSHGGMAGLRVCK